MGYTNYWYQYRDFTDGEWVEIVDYFNTLMQKEKYRKLVDLGAVNKNDPFQKVAKEIPLITKLIKDGYTGRKGKGGFYRMNKQENKKILEAINLQTGEYSTSKKIELGIEKVDLNLLINRKDKFGEYAWLVISQIIKYSSSLVPGITDKFNDIDEAMRLGFNWSMGPFEMLKSIGVKNFFDRVGDVKGNYLLEDL